MPRITTSCSSTRSEGEIITLPFSPSPSPIGRQLQLWVDDSHAGEDELRAEALKRIRDCLSRHCRELDLSGCNLRDWPPFIPASVRHINASHNHLTTLPPVSLVQLESLDMHHNWLEELPAVYLGPLAWLNVTDNFIKTLPDPLYGTLERLMVNHNPLVRLPHELPASLEWLEARQCKLREIPLRAPGLKYLDVSDNALESPPFPWPPSLIALLASNNLLMELGELPEGLTQLVVNDNCLNQFPSLLSDSLELVDISRNQIVKLSPQSLPALRRLRADNNLIQTLPDYLCDPESNVRLWLRNNPLSDETKTAIASANRISIRFNDSQRIICDPTNSANPQPGFIHALSTCFDRGNFSQQ